MRWPILQLVDSAFPAGGFAHSGGLEAALQLGEVQTAADVDRFIRLHLWNLGGSVLPFVAAAHESPAELATVDESFDATILNHVANRASRTQGRAFLATCERAFPETELASLAARRREGPAHFAPSFGAALRILAGSRRETLALFLYVSLRGVVSAAVRLGLLGPFAGQRLQSTHFSTFEAVVAACERWPVGEAATVAPLLDILGARHDTLYSRLFQS